jgi:hypothetical protein
MKRRENVAQALAVGLFLLSVYLLTYSGQFHSSDGQAMFAVTSSGVATMTSTRSCGWANSKAPTVWTVSSTAAKV